MNVGDFLLGLAVVPAVGGVAAAFWAVYQGGGRLLERAIVLRVSPKDNAQAAAMAAAIVSTPRVYVVRLLPRYLSVVVGLGRLDGERLQKIHGALNRELREKAPNVAWRRNDGSDVLGEKPGGPS